jgi:ribosome recycling factor
MKDEIISELREKMSKTGEALKKDFKKIRTGRASTALLDGIKVACYDTQMPVEQVASISVPESRLITIQPWDQSIIAEIEKSILKSELGLTPMNDGKIIRIAIPPLTEERRKELAKLAKKMAEESKIALRNHRRDANEMFKELKNEKEISEDEMYKSHDDVQKITDDFIKKNRRNHRRKRKRNNGILTPQFLRVRAKIPQFFQFPAYTNRTV